mgnify:CR=1 FL=1
MGRRIINRHPGRGSALFWGALPFLVLVVLYVTFSALRLAENPNDKLLPAFASIADAIGRMALEPDKRSGDVQIGRASCRERV